ncbi:MAG: nucleotidyltransferase domain-containing protein [Geminicoccaceae bacterium]|nr:nucleotidyltransferase domain-containing protein [Geminicoccaceae bacterium]
MRLTSEEIAIIKRLVAEAYGPRAVVRLFGSQLDDAKKGGDIDLLVEAPETTARAIRTELRLQRTLEESLGGRKVDLIVHHRGERESAFVRIAKKEGVIL